MKKIVNVLLIVMAVVMVLPTATMAATPYATYTYSAGGQVLTSPAAYVPDATIDAAYMGIPGGTMDDPRDLFIGPDQKAYIVEASQNQVIVLDRYMKFLFNIKTFTN